MKIRLLLAFVTLGLLAGAPAPARARAFDSPVGAWDAVARIDFLRTPTHMRLVFESDGAFGGYLLRQLDATVEAVPFAGTWRHDEYGQLAVDFTLPPFVGDSRIRAQVRAGRRIAGDLYFGNGLFTPSEFEAVPAVGHPDLSGTWLAELRRERERVSVPFALTAVDGYPGLYEAGEPPDGEDIGPRVVGAFVMPNGRLTLYGVDRRYAPVIGCSFAEPCPVVISFFLNFQGRYNSRREKAALRDLDRRQTWRSAALSRP